MDPQPIPVKPGLLTSELWLLLAPLLDALSNIFRTPPANVAEAINRVAEMLIIAMPVIAFIMSRSKVKSDTAHANAAVKVAEHHTVISQNNLHTAERQLRVATLGGNASRVPLVLLLIGLCFVSSSLSAADFYFLQKGKQLYLVNKQDPTQPNKPVTIQITVLDNNLPPDTDPTDPPPGDETPLAVVKALTREAIQAGGSPTTAAAISGVFSDGADKVLSGKVAPEKAVTAVGAGVRLVMAKVDDDEKWATFRQTIGDALDTLVQDKVLQTKQQYADAFREIADGMNSVTGFNGSVIAPAQEAGGPTSGFFGGKIDFKKLIEIFLALVDLWEKYKP